MKLITAFVVVIFETLSKIFLSYNIMALRLSTHVFAGANKEYFCSFTCVITPVRLIHY